jgi:regulatory protein
VRAHSTAELAGKLARRGCPAEDIEGALVRLRELGYLDDAAYAASLVHRRAGERGRAAIAAELGARGIGRELAGEALQKLGDGGQLQSARRLAAGWQGLDPRRLAGRLQRRGFDVDVIRAVIDD